ncbi:MAG TPA: hypothetical protein VGR20_11990 [Acidimicrobiia bacterium]|nr:hypothetical protein [Acidimicrobiia bacterium]
MRRQARVPIAGVLFLLSPFLTLPAAAGPVNCGAPSTRTQRIGALAHGLSEASGLVASWQRPGVGWMIRDSGRPASIYSLRLTNGNPVVREVKVIGAENTDWEDITYSVGPDGRGRLWIIESMQTHRDPYIYEVAEPDPDRAKAVPLLSRHRYQYPGTGPQNTEASFWYEGHLVLATKSSPTRLYRFRSLNGTGTLRPDYIGALTGAPRISVLRPAPDHSALIASDHETVSVFTGKGRGSHLGDFVGKGPAYSKMTFRGDNVEAGDYFPTGSCDVVMLSEARHVYRVLAG